MERSKCLKRENWVTIKPPPLTVHSNTQTYLTTEFCWSLVTSLGKALIGKSISGTACDDVPRSYIPTQSGPIKPLVLTPQNYAQFRGPCNYDLFFWLEFPNTKSNNSFCTLCIHRMHMSTPLLSLCRVWNRRWKPSVEFSIYSDHIEEEETLTLTLTSSLPVIDLKKGQESL